MSRAKVVEYLVYSGSGHGGHMTFVNREDAIEDARRKAEVPSYFRAYPGQRTGATLIKRTVITETVPF